MLLPSGPDPKRETPTRINLSVVPFVACVSLTHREPPSVPLTHLSSVYTFLPQIKE